MYWFESGRLVSVERATGAGADQRSPLFWIRQFAETPVTPQQVHSLLALLKTTSPKAWPAACG